MDDESEALFRKTAFKKYGQTKGALSKTIISFLKKIDKENELNKSWNDFEKLIDNSPVDLKGGKPYESRNELYDR